MIERFPFNLIQIPTQHPFSYYNFRLSSELIEKPRVEGHRFRHNNLLSCLTKGAINCRKKNRSAVFAQRAGFLLI